MTKPLGQLSQTEKSEKKETYWTPTEKESLKETYGTEILIENGTLDEVNTTDAPSDAWIITYEIDGTPHSCLLYTSPSPRDKTVSRMPSSA